MEKIEIWEVASGRHTAPSLLSTIDGTKTEDELEDILVRSPDMLERGLQLVGRQTPMSGGGYLDLLAVDGDGRLVVFELKRGTLTRDAVAQVVDYASDLDAVDLEDLANLIVNHSGSGDIATIDDFIDWYDRQYDGKSIESLTPPRMVLVGLGVDNAAERMVNGVDEGTGGLRVREAGAERLRERQRSGSRRSRTTATNMDSTVLLSDRPKMDSDPGTGGTKMNAERSPAAGTYRATAFADAKPELAAPGATQERLEHLREYGFVIVTDFVDSPWIPILREAGRRVTEACAPANGYRKIDCSKGYVHRSGDDEPWAIRGLLHPGFEEPGFAEFLGSREFLDFVAVWCHGLGPGDLVMSPMLLWCNPRVRESGLSWHRDVTWWGTGESYFAQREVRGEGPEAYSAAIERIRWKEIQEKNEKSITERNGVNIFLALVDDECHELIPGSHQRWRTPFEHDVLLPREMKEQGVPHTPSWNGVDPLPGQVAIRLKPGEALVRNGATIHTGHTVPERERNTLSIGWSRWLGRFTGDPSVADVRHAWQLDPAVREALPHEWMKTAWDRWAETQKLGDTLKDRYPEFDIGRIKAGKVVGWRGELVTPGGGSRCSVEAVPGRGVSGKRRRSALQGANA